VDAGMNDLIRPSLYQAYHEIVPVVRKKGRVQHPKSVDVVGPVCESGDFFAKDRGLPPVEPGDLLAVMSCGAYGYVMSSNYNSRPRIPEVVVRGRRFFVAKRRETYEDLIKGEKILDV
jgi:diaminopimelate decarboxylase